MTFELSILGSNGALPAHGRHPTAQVLNHNESYFLLDCGEGTQMRLDALNLKRSKINHIFISHLHGDHYYGLMGLLTSYILLGRQQKLTIYAPPGIQSIIDIHIDIEDSSNGFEIEIVELPILEAPSLCFQNEVIQVFYFPLQHRITCYGYFFKEVKQKRNVIKDKIEAYNLSVEEIIALKEGQHLNRDGAVIENHLLTKDPKLQRSYAYCTDTCAFAHQYDLLKNCDLLYHEATFMHNDAERASQTFHTTTKQAAEVAKKLNAKQLIIGHFSAKYKNLEPLLEEAKTVFENSILALEGAKFKIEYPI